MSASTSPAKRALETPDGDEESVQTAKRPRRERVPSEAIEEDADEDGRDPSDDEDDRFEDDDIDANIAELKRQRKLERQRRDPDALATAGVVKEISLINFMCHENLTVPMGEKINFVVGHNGSGKSAILSGLAVALGAKATVTGRGAGLKAMIMGGKDRAKVILTMRNAGEDAFMPELFGDEIVIERNFDKTGASNFRFRATKDGKVLSDKRDMLAKMCRQWQINIDSPLCMLTQDNAKTFLARTDPKVMYSFFLKGTGLASILEEYQTTKVCLDKLSRDLANAQEALPEQEEKVRKLKNQIQRAEKVRNLRKRQEDVKARLAWAFVGEKEKELKGVRLEIEEIEEKLEAIAASLSEVDNRQDRAKSDVDKIKSEIAAFIENHQQTQRDISAKKKSLTEARNALAEARRNVDNCRDELRLREEEIAEMEEKLAAARREQEGELNPDQVRLQKKLEEAQAQQSGLQRQLPQSERGVATAKAEAETVEGALREAELEMNEAETNFNDVKHSLDNLKASRTDRFAPYGRNLRRVIEAIETTQWKHSKPIGPLGLHVQLMDPVYRNCFANLLGSTLCAFAVRDPADQAQLQRIFEQCARQYQFSASPFRQGGPPNYPSIILHKGDLFDFSTGDLSRQGVSDTVLSKLKVEDPHVLRILVNSYQIERTLVARNDEDALSLINRVLGPRLESIVVVSASEFRHNGHLRNRLRQSGPQNKWRGPDMFVTDPTSEIERLQPILAERDGVLRAKRAEFHARRQEAVAARDKVKKAEDMLRRNRDGIPHMKRTVDSITDKLKAFRPIDGNATEMSLDQVRSEHAGLQGELSTLEGKRDVAQRDLEGAEAACETAQDTLTSFYEQLNRKKDMHVTLQSEVKKCDNERTHYKGSIRRAEEHLDQDRKMVQEGETTLNNWTSAALAFMDRPAEFGNAPELEEERKAIDRQVEEAKRTTNIDLDAIMQQHVAESERLNKAKGLIEKFRGIERLLKTGFEDRTTKWQLLRRTTSLRINMRFIENIRSRGFDGRIHFDHEVGEELKLEVATSNDASTQREIVYKSPASLSGGERSFVTVSLLLSMWDSAPSNLRCLDEWDVFLDSANRRIAASLLVGGAKDTTSKQFVLISPLDMNGVKTGGPGNKVIRLADPVRNQRRLEEFQ